MPESHRLYLHQMLRIEVARALSDEGHDVLRAAEVGQNRAGFSDPHPCPFVQQKEVIL